MHNFNWDDLKYLLAVARAGSLTGAAKALSVNHTTVGRRLSALQERAGTRLFDRTSDGLVATQAGEEVRRIAERMEADAQALDAQILGLDERLAGHLVVTTMDIVVYRHREAFRAFGEHYPAIELELVVDNTLRNLTRREADVALRTTNTPTPTLFGRKLGRLEFALYAGRSLFEANERSGDPGAYPWLGWPEHLGAALTEKWMAQHVPNARVACRVDSTLVMLDLLRAGVGIGFAHCVDADPDPELVRLRDVEPGFGMDFWVLTHPELRNTSRVRAFMKHFADATRGWEDRFAGASTV